VVSGTWCGDVVVLNGPAVLKPFWLITQWLQGRATQGHHGAIWEALPALELLLAHLEEAKAECPVSNPRLKESINNAWTKLKEYNNLTDNSHSVYAAATLLNPSQRGLFFKKYWTGEQEEWIPIMEKRCWQY